MIRFGSTVTRGREHSPEQGRSAKKQLTLFTPESPIQDSVRFQTHSKDRASRGVESKAPTPNKLDIASGESVPVGISPRPSLLFALELSQTKTKDGSATIKEPSTRLSLLQASLDHKDSPYNFVQADVMGADIQDCAEIAKAFTASYFPEKDKLTKLAITLEQSKDESGQSQLTSEHSLRALYQTALDPETRADNFLKRATNRLESEDDIKVVRDLCLPELYPERFETLKSLHQFCHDRDKAGIFDWLAQAAVAAPQDETAVQMAQRARELVKANIPNEVGYGVEPAPRYANPFNPYMQTNEVYETELLRISAEQSALTSERATFLMEVAEAKSEWGSYEVDEMWPLRALYEAATDPTLGKKQIFEQVLDSRPSWQSKRFLQKRLATEFFPAMAETVDEITASVEGKDRDRMWEDLMTVSYENPHLKEPRLLLDKALSTKIRGNTAYVNVARALLLERVSPQDPRTKLALSMGRNEDKDSGLQEDESRAALYSAAFESELSDIDFLVKVVENSDDSDKPSLLKSLGPFVLERSGLEVPPDILADSKAGKVTSHDLKRIYDTLESRHQHQGSVEAEISIDENILIIGDENLEVDL